jgi:hypothetical protein
MSCIIHRRIEDLGVEVRRLEERILRYREESAQLEGALELASRPLDFCVCADGMCPHCTVGTAQQENGARTSDSSDNVMAGPSLRLEDCREGLQVCEFLAWSSPGADMTIKLGDAVRACKEVPLYKHLKNNSVRSKLEKYLQQSPQWAFLGDGTFQLLIGPTQVFSAPERREDPVVFAVVA